MDVLSGSLDIHCGKEKDGFENASECLDGLRKLKENPKIFNSSTKEELKETKKLKSAKTIALESYRINSSEVIVDTLLTIIRDKLEGVNIFKADDVVITGYIGAGGYGVVKKGYFVNTKEELAIKFLNPFAQASNIEATYRNILQEIITLSYLKHENIPKFYGVVDNNNDQLGLIFSFINGINLSNFISSISIEELTYSDRLDISIKLVEIVKDINEIGVIHRDIKPANIMINPDLSIILLDFGISRILDVTTFTKSDDCTFFYSPPEMLIEEESSEDETKFKINRKFDIWSLGCVIYKLFSENDPWIKKFKDRIKIILSLQSKKKYLYKNNKQSYVALVPEFVDSYPELFDLINKCFEFSPERITFDVLLDGLKEIRQSLIK